MKTWQKVLLIFVGIYWVWMALSLILLFVNIPQFHYGNLIGRTYKQDYYPLYDWDLPLSADADFDQDGKIDQITAGGCAHFGYDGTPQGLMCDPYYSNQATVVDFKGQYPVHSYLIKENNQWFIIVLDNKYSLARYAIKQNGLIEKLQPTTQDFKNEVVYLFPLAPFWPLYLLQSAATQMVFRNNLSDL